VNAWVGIYNQNNGNSYANKAMVYHSISATKIFSKLQLEASVRLNNIFMNPNYDNTTFLKLENSETLVLGITENYAKY
jgi:hypothetical protein